MGEYVDSIIVFFSEHKDFIMTIATMVIGIVAGWFPTLKRISQIILTVITTILFPILVIMCYQDLTIVKLSIGVSLLWCLLSLFVFQKEEVSRRKIGKLIIKFTKSADKDQPICIFGGDLNFFGSFILNNRRWNLFNLNRNKYIETNEQYIQIRDSLSTRSPKRSSNESSAMLGAVSCSLNAAAIALSLISWSFVIVFSVSITSHLHSRNRPW